MIEFLLNQKITFVRYPKPDNAVFSILIPSWNNYEHLKLLVESIQKNSRHQHQICVHLNEETDNRSRDFLEGKGISYSISTENTGVCFGFNAAFALAECPYLVFIDDDMYVAPDWDKPLLDEVNKQNSIYWAISGSMIEREDKGNSCAIYPYNYGSHPENFEEERFLKEVNTLPHRDWSGSLWYPLVLHRDVWQLVGGLSVEFSPGMYSDPDFMMKLWQIGIREFKGLSGSRVYHFMSKSTKRVKRNDGRTQFFKKWNMSSSTFLKFYLGLGEDYSGPRLMPQGSAFRKAVLKDKFKKIFT